MDFMTFMTVYDLDFGTGHTAKSRVVSGLR